MASDDSSHGNQEQDKVPLPKDDDRVRWFLVRATVILMVAVLVAYTVTRDIGVLGTATIIGVAVVAVYGFYFPARKGRK